MRDPIEKFLYSKSVIVFLLLSCLYTYRAGEWCRYGESIRASNYRKAIWALTAVIGFMIILSRFDSRFAKLWEATIILGLIIIEAVLVMLYCQEVYIIYSDIYKVEEGRLVKRATCDIDDHTLTIMRMLNTACVVMSLFVLAYMASLTSEPIWNKLRGNQVPSSVMFPPTMPQNMA